MAAPYTESAFGEDAADTGDVRKLFLEVFSGLVLNAFNTKQTTMDRQIVRTITSGKSAQFPSVWKASGGYHTPGTELNGRPILAGARVIDIESLLVADVFVDSLDELLNHYSIRAEYATQLGEYLANKHDMNSYAYMQLGARASHFSQDSAFDGTQLAAANLATSAAVLKTAIWDAAAVLDVNDVPDSDRYCGVSPAQYYLLLTDAEFINRDFSPDNGSQAGGVIEKAAGFEIVKTNNIPNITWVTGHDDHPTDTKVDWSTVAGDLSVADCWHKSAIGTVKLMGLQTEEEYSARHQGSLLLAKYAIGQDFLRPEAVVALEDSV